MTNARAELTLATCQAHNTIPISRALADYLSERLGASVRFLDSDWVANYQGITAGDVSIGWICGRPYVELADRLDAPLQLLVAPVMAGERYEDRPIYFSDVIVRNASPFQSFADLRGASWAYNEPGSQSGYHVTRYHLARLGLTGSFFGRAIGSGAHLRSLDWVLSEEADASAIDSTVLEWELERDPQLAGRIRVIETFGPSPIPPLVASTRLPPSLVESIRDEFLGLNASAAGRQLLAAGNLRRFVAVTDRDYDAIREMQAVASGIAL